MSEKSSSSGKSVRATKSGVKPGQSRPKGFSIGKDPVAGAAEPSVEAHKFDLGSPETASPDSPQPAYENLGELPASYGESRLYLVAKDPQWLFSYWDVDWAQYASEIRSGRVILKILLEGDGSEAQSVAINPYASNWYLPVTNPGATYIGELGYEDEDGEWNVICRSGSAEVPVQEMAPESESLFAKVPMHISFEHLLATVKSAMAEGETLMGVLARLQREGASFGGLLHGNGPDERKRVLEALLGPELVSQLSMNSETIDEALRKQLEEGLGSLPSSESSARLGGLVETAPTSLSSGFGASWSAQPFSEQQKRGFFMHVNAEVIFYGGTDPDARVWIDGNEIELAPDGTFSYHFKFPDGKFEIPVVAESPDGVELRMATLTFQRDTSRQGDVGHTSQPGGMGTPMGEKS